MGIDTSLSGVPDFDNLMVISTGIITVTHSANTEVATAFVTHGLGYAPIAIVYELSSLDLSLAAVSPIPSSSALVNSGANTGRVYKFVDWSTGPNTLTIFIQTPNIGVSMPPYDYASAFTLYFKYYILRNTAIV